MVQGGKEAKFKEIHALSILNVTVPLYIIFPSPFRNTLTLLIGLTKEEQKKTYYCLAYTFPLKKYYNLMQNSTLSQIRFPFD